MQFFCKINEIIKITSTGIVADLCKIIALLIKKSSHLSLRKISSILLNIFIKYSRFDSL